MPSRRPRDRTPVAATICRGCLTRTVAVTMMTKSFLRVARARPLLTTLAATICPGFRRTMTRSPASRTPSWSRVRPRARPRLLMTTLAATMICRGCLTATRTLAARTPF
ncbi:hypothetical protein L916_16908 [Phytophthora nicotianae]|uniref:Uncharacterized protein n=1 Tax=Phytophthora nicotianae TaxID=4792 RepID=W2I9J9_PHYNI|nr:hypothetical protein L916_16908 [Phytophthora nicotianae]